MAKRIYTRRNTDTSYSKQLEQRLQAEADRLVRQMQEQLTRSLVRQMQSDGFSGGGSSSSDGSGFGNYTSLFTSALRLISVGRSKSSATETVRSRETRSQFRLSQSQAAAEANAALMKSQKNT